MSIMRYINGCLKKIGVTRQMTDVDMTTGAIIQKEQFGLRYIKKMSKSRLELAVIQGEFSTHALLSYCIRFDPQ